MSRYSAGAVVFAVVVDVVLSSLLTSLTSSSSSLLSDRWDKSGAGICFRSKTLTFLRFDPSDASAGFFRRSPMIRWTETGFGFFLTSKSIERTQDWINATYKMSSVEQISWISLRFGPFEMHSDWLKEVTRFEISNRSALFQLCQWES